MGAFTHELISVNDFLHTSLPESDGRWLYSLWTEPSKCFVDWFTQVAIEFEGAEGGIIENDHLKDHPFRLKIWMKKVKTPLDMLSMAESYMIVEDKLSSRFENLVSADTNSSLLAEKESYWGKDNFGRGLQEPYDKYIPLTISWEVIYSIMSTHGSSW